MPVYFAANAARSSPSAARCWSQAAGGRRGERARVAVERGGAGGVGGAVGAERRLPRLVAKSAEPVVVVAVEVVTPEAEATRVWICAMRAETSAGTRMLLETMRGSASVRSEVFVPPSTTGSAT